MRVKAKKDKKIKPVNGAKCSELIEKRLQVQDKKNPTKGRRDSAKGWAFLGVALLYMPLPYLMRLSFRMWAMFPVKEPLPW
jgi:hypothetical protein